MNEKGTITYSFGSCCFADTYDLDIWFPRLQPLWRVIIKKKTATFGWLFFCTPKPRDSRVVQKRLTDEKESSKYVIIVKTCQSKQKTYLEDSIMKKVSIDNNSLAHTSWNCKYHIVFAPKYRRKVFFEEKRLEIREILRQLCQWKGVEIVEGEVCPDHIHMLVSIPPKMSVSGFMGYLKGKSAMMIFQKFGNMKFAYRNREFWCKGYYVDTVGKNTKAIKEYIADQLQRDRESDQLSMFDPRDPFMGGK